MDRKWELDESNAVTLHIGMFGTKTISANGKELYASRKMTRKNEIDFSLPDGRAATLQIIPEFIGRPTVHLRVGGNLVMETPKKPITCGSCGAAAKPWDRFCGKCGKPMPSVEDYELRGNISSAKNAIKALAVLYLLGGLLMFSVTKSQNESALTKLEGMQDEATFPQQIEGRTYKVGELRKQIEWEPWGVLIVNLILMAIMAALAFWANKAPLPAVLIATSVYVVLIVVNAIGDPSSLVRGWIIKLIVIAFLFKGIKAALALRTARA